MPAYYSTNHNNQDKDKDQDQDQTSKQHHSPIAQQALMPFLCYKFNGTTIAGDIWKDEEAGKLDMIKNIM